MEYEGNDELRALEHGAPKYNKFLVTTFAKYRPKNAEGESSLDFGAGIGALSCIWEELGFGRIDCLEPDARQSSIIQSRGFVVFRSVDELKKAYGFIFTSNVLEHIKEDEAVLSELVEKALSEEGTLVIYVPAFQILFSKMDEKVGHYRRYRKKHLIHVVQKSGLEVILCEYVDSLGFFASLILKFFKLGSDAATNSAILKLYDGFIFPFSRILDKLGAKRFFGKNLLVVARKNPSH